MDNARNDSEPVTLVIDRSTDAQSVALVEGGALVAEAVLDGSGVRSGDWAVRTRDFLGGRRPGRIVVGTGPGSFAGIRAALAFAQGWALGSRCEVLGLPSPCAYAPSEGPLAVAGDARRGLFWIALFDGPRLVAPVSLAAREDLHGRVPLSAPVVSPDARRIGADLAEIFPGRYRPDAPVPTAAGLARAFLANPSLLAPEPLPIYLNPAVRD